VLEAGERRQLVEQLVLRHLAQPEVLPPRCFFLAPMPVEHVGQQPDRLLPGGALLAIFGHAFEQPAGQLGCARLALPHRRAGIARLIGRAGDRGAAGDQLPAQAFEPFAQRQRRKAVVAIVGLDGARAVVVLGQRRPQLEAALDHPQRASRLLERLLALEAVEGLERLDRVLLDAGPQRLANHRVEVDEAAGAQQPVDLRLAGGVAAHQALDRPGLVHSVVIHVHAGVARPALHDHVDQRLEAPALGGAAQSPAAVITSCATIRRGRPRLGQIRRRPAEQVLETAVVHVRVGLEIEEQITRRWRRQAREAASRLDGEHLAHRLVLGAPDELDARLLAHPHVTLARSARRLPRDGQGLGREGGEGADVAGIELAGLEARETGDEAQVIVSTPLPVTAWPPAADVAVRDRIRIGEWLRLGIGGGLEPAPHQPVIGQVLLDPEGLEREVGPPRHDVHVLGEHALHLAEQLAVETELEDRARPGLARELGVERLVGPVAERARARDLAQHVGAPDPAPARERRLGDHLGAGEHRLERALEPAGARLVVETGDGHALPLEVRKVGALVLEAALGQHVGFGPVVVGRLPPPLDHPALERGEVPAREVVGQVGGRQTQLPGVELHAVFRAPGRTLCSASSSMSRAASFGPRPSSSCLRNTKASLHGCSRIF